MEQPRIVNNHAAQSRSILYDVTLSERETALLLQRFLEGKREVDDADIRTLVEWGNQCKGEACALALVLSGKLAVEVQGTTVRLLACPLPKDAA